MTPSSALRTLGLPVGAEAGAIRKAYADRLRSLDVDADPDAYARLRQARDAALRAAKFAAAKLEAPVQELEPDEQHLLDTEGEPAGQWAYAAPHLAIKAPLAGERVIAGQSPVAEPAVSTDPSVLHAPATLASSVAALAGPPVLALPAEADVTALRYPDRELVRVLHTDEDPGPAMTDAEEARARRCLKMVLVDAAQADLSRHRQIEDWLSDLLAAMWPRSSPLLEATADAFGWENERGQLRERHSIGWLNARLRGIRFQDNVAEPDHPLHKAWVELRRPGWSSWLDRRRVRRTQIDQLLSGVRKHFPEVESHFDPQRVSSWEGGSSSPSANSGGFSFPYAIIAVLVFQIIRIGSQSWDSKPANPDGGYKLPVESASVDPDYDRILAAAVEEAFGKGSTIAWLREKQASLATTFEARLRASRSSGADESKAIEDAVALVRRLVYLDGRLAKGPVLVDAMRIHLGHMTAASKAGPDACLRYLASAQIGSEQLPADVRKQERQLAAQMVEQGALVDPRIDSSGNAAVPGELVGQVIEATGLPQDRVHLALQKKGTPAEQCAVTRALLRATLDWSGKGQTEILRIL